MVAEQTITKRKLGKSDVSSVILELQQVFLRTQGIKRVRDYRYTRVLIDSSQTQKYSHYPLIELRTHKL